MTDLIQRSFAAGELSPDLYARADQVKYTTGLRKCLNFFVRKSGGISNRPGTRLVTEGNRNSPVGLSFVTYRLIPFVFNDEQSYVLEFSPYYFRVIKRGALVTVTPGIYFSTQSYLPGQAVTFGGVNYVCIQNALNQQPDISPSFWRLLQGTIFQYPTIYNENELADLRFFQSADIIFIVHPNHFMLKVIRAADDRWYTEIFVLTAWASPPANLQNGGQSAGSNTLKYGVTAVNDSGQETVMTAPLTITIAATPSPTTPITLVWSPVSGAVEYNVYRGANGKYGYIGSAIQENPLVASVTFKDVYGEPDMNSNPPVDDNSTLFNSPGNYPAVVSIVQQRLTLAASNNAPEKIWMSKTGQYYDFNVSLPSQDDDSVRFVMAGKKFGRVRAIIEQGLPIVFTESGEWLLRGDADGAIIPTAINAVQQAYNGCSAFVDPVVVDSSILYVQARGSILRDFKYSQEADGYEGKDLTVYATHLFENHTIVAMDYQQNPDSIVWCVRDDGKLLGLSYLREHQIWGWHQHETDGDVIDVCVIPEGSVDVLYLAVRRRIQGVDRFYIERMAEREETDPLRMYYVDCGLSYDGTAPVFSPAMRLNLQVTTPNDVVDLNASSPFFSTLSVGNAIVLYRYDEPYDPVEIVTTGVRRGNIIDSIRLDIKEYVNTQLVRVTPNRNVPVWAQVDYVSDWSYAVDNFTNLEHLSGKSVAIVADGNIVSNGIDEPLYIVEDGSVTIDRPASFVHIGLPYVCDAETLDVDLPQNLNSVRTKPKTISHISTIVKKTPSLKAGTSFEKLTEYKIREFENMGDPTKPKTGLIDVTVDDGWDEESRVCVRQDQPLPATILAVIPRTLVAKD